MGALGGWGGAGGLKGRAERPVVLYSKMLRTAAHAAMPAASAAVRSAELAAAGARRSALRHRGACTPGGPGTLRRRLLKTVGSSMTWPNGPPNKVRPNCSKGMSGLPITPYL
jgi:hypothetical protein